MGLLYPHRPTVSPDVNVSTNELSTCRVEYKNIRVRVQYTYQIRIIISIYFVYSTISHTSPMLNIQLLTYPVTVLDALDARCPLFVRYCISFFFCVCCVVQVAKTDEILASRPMKISIFHHLRKDISTVQHFLIQTILNKECVYEQ